MGQGRKPVAARLAIAMLCVASLGACDFIRGYAEGDGEVMGVLEQEQYAYLEPDELGKARFVFDDLGHLNTDTLRSHAIPWKMTAAAMLIHNADVNGGKINLSTLSHLFEEFGFIVTDSVGNWTGYPDSLNAEKPLGMVSGPVRRRLPAVELEVANLTCASCHAGRLYDERGNATDIAWLGLPNTSLDLDAYINRVYASLKYAVRDEARLMDTIKTLFPDISETEQETLEEYGLGSARERIASIENTTDRPLPFDNGGPGITNGVAALKLQLGLIEPDVLSAEHGYTAIPDLSRAALSSALLYDGSYTVPGGNRFEPFRAERTDEQWRNSQAAIVAYFTVPTQGGTAESAMAAIPQLEDVLDFVAVYKPPLFPGKVDTSLAAMGSDVYRERCASCHGAYGGSPENPELVEYPNRFTPVEEINTDPARANAMSDELVTHINTSTVRRRVDAQRTGGYVAPALDGLWATAPYLHNGSVPTVWHLLYPEQRPTVFEVGGHRLDYRQLGIDGVLGTDGIYRYPSSYRPFSGSALYDTRLPGKSNRGHERQFAELSDEDKRRLLEYLKLL